MIHIAIENFLKVGRGFLKLASTSCCAQDPFLHRLSSCCTLPKLFNGKLIILLLDWLSQVGHVDVNVGLSPASSL